MRCVSFPARGDLSGLFRGAGGVARAGTPFLRRVLVLNVSADRSALLQVLRALYSLLVFNKGFSPPSSQD